MTRKILKRSDQKLKRSEVKEYLSKNEFWFGTRAEFPTISEMDLNFIYLV